MKLSFVKGRDNGGVLPDRADVLTHSRFVHLSYTANGILM